MLLPALVYRRSCYLKIVSDLEDRQKKREIAQFWEMDPQDQETVKNYDVVGRSLLVMTYLIAGYSVLCHVVGCLLLYLALLFRPNQPELQARGLTYFDNATFLTIGAFSNGGFTITSDSLFGLRDNPLAVLILAGLIVLGNTAVPNALRALLIIVQRVDNYFNSETVAPLTEPPLAGSVNSDENQMHPSPRSQALQSPSTPWAQLRVAMQFILDNPRRVTTHIFNSTQTLFLARMILCLNFVEFACFVGATFTRKADLAVYPPRSWPLWDSSKLSALVPLDLLLSICVF